MKRLLGKSGRVLAVVTAVMAALAFGVGAAAAEGVWVDGKVHGLVTGPPSASNTRPARLYVIAPVRRKHPLHPLADARAEGWGAHDHVTAKVFSGPCDLTMVVAGAHEKGNIRTRRTQTSVGQRALVYAARLGGRMLPLTSVARIRRAEAARLVAAVDLHTVISCSVQP